MKIYMPNLDELVNQAVEPVYLIRTASRRDYLKQHVLTVTAYNQKGNVLELRVLCSEVLPGSREDGEGFQDCISKETQCREQLEMAGFKCHAGYIHDEPIWGDPDGYKAGFKIGRNLKSDDFAKDVEPPAETKLTKSKGGAS